MAVSKKKNAGGYSRVSSGVQAKGFSLGDQRNCIKSHCRKNKLELVEVYEDAGRSGDLEIKDRAGLRQLMTDAKAGMFEVVVIKRWDRLSRKLLQSLLVEQKLKEYGVEIIVIDQNTDGLDEETANLIRNVLASFSEFEKALTVKKMANGKEKKFEAQSGPVCGNVAYGYRTEGPRGNRRLVEDPEEQKVLKSMKKLRRKGWSYIKIAKALNGEIIVLGEDLSAPCRPWGGRQTRWHQQKIKNALTSKHSKGKVSYQGKSKKIK